MIDKLNSQKGIALVTAMLLALMAMAIVTATIYMVIQSTEVSGIKKRYATALGAAKGGTEATALIISNRAIPSDLIGLTTIPNQACLDLKFSHRRTDWGGCNTGETVSNTSYDVRFDFGDYSVYAKIVSTTLGNTRVGESLEVKGVVSGYQSGYIKNPITVPYMYRLEVRSENETNPQDSADITALYGH